MGSFDFNNLPQQPLYLEDKRSPAEKEASAKLLNEKRIVMVFKRVGLGFVLGTAFGILIGIKIMA